MSEQVMPRVSVPPQEDTHDGPSLPDHGSRSARSRGPRPLGGLLGARVALVRVAIELPEAEKVALAQALERRFGHAIQLEVEIDSRILGGVWVQVGDTIIDGTLQGRLEALRHHLRASSRAMALRSEQSSAAEGDKP